MRKSNGPRMDPCGIRKVVMFISDVELLFITNCFLPLIYYSNHFSELT